MKRVILFFAVLSIIIVLSLSTCHKNPVEPPFNIRNLTWTIDTLSHPDNWQTYLYDIWGSSSNDVYVVGGANTSHGILWRYTLDKWFKIKISGSEGGPIHGSIEFADVFGFSKNDIFICGVRSISNPNPPPDRLDKSLLIHWDGVNWQEISTPEGHILTAIWGNFPDNIWFGGVNGTIFRYDGSVVEKDTIPLAIPKHSSTYWNVLSISGNELETDMLLVDYHYPNRYYFLSYKNNKWVVEDSSFIYNSSGIWMSPSGTLYTTGLSLYRKNGDSWEKVLDSENTLWSFGIHGTSDDNFFLVGRSNHNTGAVYHYNGKDWFSFKELELPGITYYEVWTDGKEVFIVGVAGTKSIVLHGK